jgi:ABC-type multidrug transport system fused ATPase/permease subunit
MDVTPRDASARPSLRRGAALVRAEVAMHPKLFATAVAGAAVFAICTVASSAAVRWVVDHVILPRFETGHVAAGTVLAGCGLIVVIGFVRAAGVVVRRTFAGMTEARVGEDLTKQVVHRFVAQPLRWHQRRSAGDLVARAGVDVDTATAVLAPLPFASSTIVLVVVAAAWLLVTDALLGSLAVAMFPVLIVMNLVYQRRVERHFDEAQSHLGQLSAAVHESFEGVMVVKAFGAEGREADRLATMASRLREARVRAVALRSTFESVLDAVPNLANIALLTLGAARVRDGAISIGELTSILYLFTLIAFPLRLIGFALSELPYSLAGWQRVREIVDEPIEPDPTDRLEEPPRGFGVQVEDVSFGFEPGRPVLSGVSFAVPAGRTVAVVGPTGAGKSTLMQIVAGLLAPDEGRVAVDGRRPALVFQEPFLLAGSIRDNITLGDPDIADVDGALSLAAARDFVDALPAGPDTIVGERGISLSGGQRQRVALARALARDPDVLLLDDTTSALDPSTEAAILANLRTRRATVTTVIVASRPSTIALADEVVFLYEGMVLAQGPSFELLMTVPEYRALVEAYEQDREGAVAGAREDGS